MSKTKNQIINEVIDATIARLTPADTPETISEEVTQDIEGLIVLENVARGKGCGLRVPEVLPNPVIAKLMAAMFCIRRVACAGLDADEEFDLLCLYQEDGPDAGTYVENENALYRVAIRYNVQLTKPGFNEVCRRLRAIVPRVARTMDPDLIAVNNGIFDFKKKELLPFSPDYVFLAKSHVDYDPDAVNVTIHNPDDGTDWDVDSWVESLSDDPEIVDLIWEILGAIIRPFVPWDKSAWFYATEGNNGKGTLCELMRNLCGKSAVAAIKISDFSKDFHLEPLLRATAIIADENDVGTYIDQAAELKATITNDVLSINRKHKVIISFRFFGFMVQCLNEFPRIRDKSDSFYRRQLFVPFGKCFTGRERRYIKADYLHRPEVLEYVLYRVLHMDYYSLSNPDSCQEVLNRYKLFNDPVRQFFQEMERRFVWKLLPFTFLYALFKAWFSKNCPTGKVQGRNTFIDEVINVTKDSQIWHCPSRNQTIRSAGRMNLPEPLILEYDLKDWMNPNYVGSDATRLATTAPNDEYRGLTRREDSLDDFGFTENTDS